MSSQVETWRVEAFKQNAIMLSQQKGSRLRKAVRNERQASKADFYDRIGLVTATKSVARHGDTVLTDTPHSRRRNTMSIYRHADMVDKADKVQLINDPTNPYAQAFSAAFGRAMDDEIIEGALGTAYSGESGSSSVVLPDAQKIVPVSSGSATNLNVSALRFAKRKFDEAEVEGKRYLVHNASALQALLAENEITSADYNTIRALVRGEVNTFLGFEFIRSERVAFRSSVDFNTSTGQVGTGSTLSDGISCFAVAEGGVVLGTGIEPMARIEERADKNHGLQIFMEMMLGATRLEEEKVIEIVCSQ